MMGYKIRIMKKHLFSFLLLATFTFNISAQEANKPSETEKNLRKHVFYLADDKLEGRRTGEKGATFAAGYVANMFARYKLKTGYIDNSKGKTAKSFLQPFPYIAGIEVNETSSLKLSNTQKLFDVELKNNWLPLKSSPNAVTSYSKVVFAGFGIESKNLKYNDYKDLDVKNKIVLAFAGTPDYDNPHNSFFLFNAHTKAKIAKEKGAIGLILISREQNFAEDKLVSKFNPTLGETAIPTMVVSRQAVSKLLKTDEKGLIDKEKFLNEIASGKQKLSERKKPLGLPPLLAKLKISLNKKIVQAYNVIGVIEGKDPVLKNEAIIIGAHYDHLGRGGSGSLSPNSKDIHNGADDNASGTSAMLELARQFSKSKNNKRTLIFIAFGGEEEGLLGSKAYTKNPVFPLNKTIAMINMDMVGRLKDRKLTVGGIGTASEWQKLVTEKQPIEIGKGKVKIQKASDLSENNVPISVGASGKIMATKSADNKVFNLQLNQDDFGPSDHSSFYAKKIPVLFFFTGTHSDYHKPTDDAEKINYQGLEHITSFVSEIVKAIDQNPKRPEYTVAKSSMQMGGRRAFNVSLGTIPSYSDNTNDGLAIDGVRKGSAADKAGIKGGDKIIKLAGKEIRNISDYMFMLGSMKPKETYEVVVMRGKEKLTLKIIPDARK